MNMETRISFSVIMPTFNQSWFIRRAIDSLFKQTYTNWELIIVNDGSTDETETFITDYMNDRRVRYIRNAYNTGLGHALNQGLDVARYDHIAYLPSDDFYFDNHLESLSRAFSGNDELFLVYSGVRYESRDSLFYSPDVESRGLRRGNCLQLVQTAHRKTAHRWLTRDEYVTEDLYQMFWGRVSGEGAFGRTDEITCFWTQHPHQRHKITGERYGGGLNKYRLYYKVKNPIRMKVSKQKFIDEGSFYSRYRKECVLCERPLKILLVGELAYNPERIYALEEAGHKLYGLWDTSPVFSFSTVGPLPFGHVEDIPEDGWLERVRQIKPDIIYAMLNFGSVPFVWSVMRQCRDIPFVWHFKECPHLALRQGNFEKLMWLYHNASGRIFLNEPVKRWFSQFLPPSSAPTLCMDGDLPKKDIFKDCFSPKLSDTDVCIHTVVTGRMIGISGSQLAWLAKHDIHVHLYTENYFDDRERENISRYRIAPHHFHVHPHVASDRWTEELSKYDAGWLHCAKSYNNGNMLHTTWDDFNIPARVCTYAAAGLPVIIPRNKGHVLAVNEVVGAAGAALFYDDYDELLASLKDEITHRTLTANMLANRMRFSFDYHVNELINLFINAIDYKACGK